jgi:hypothetical protein
VNDSIHIILYIKLLFFTRIKSLLNFFGHFCYEEFEDTKEVIRIRILKKNRQHNGQKTEEQTTQWSKEKVQKDNNDLQNIHTKLKIE